MATLVRKISLHLTGLLSTSSGFTRVVTKCRAISSDEYRALVVAGCRATAGVVQGY